MIKASPMLTDAQQNILRGALVQKVNATCDDCPAGIDLTQANFSIHVFAETLVGNCSQADRVLYNVTKKDHQFGGKLLRPLAFFIGQLHRWSRLPFRCDQPHQ